MVRRSFAQKCVWHLRQVQRDLRRYCEVIIVWAFLTMLGMRMMENEKYRNVVVNDGNVITIGNKAVFVNGGRFPLPNGKCSSSTVIDNHIFIDGYELKDGKWKQTPRAIFHKYF